MVERVRSDLIEQWIDTHNVRLAGVLALLAAGLVLLPGWQAWLD
jgi:hypothetical protein